MGRTPRWAEPFTFESLIVTGAQPLQAKTKNVAADAIGPTRLPRWTMTTTATSGFAKTARSERPRGGRRVHAPITSGWLSTHLWQLYEVETARHSRLAFTLDDFIYQAKR